jgi:hypothetical protein
MCACVCVHSWDRHYIYFQDIYKYQFKIFKFSVCDKDNLFYFVCRGKGDREKLGNFS